MRRPVELVVNLTGPGSVHGGLLLSRVNAAVAAQATVVVGDIDRPGGQEDQRLRLPAIKRQIGHALLVHELSHRGVTTDHQLGVRRHGDLLCRLSHF